MPSTSSSAPPDLPPDASSGSTRRSRLRWVAPAVLVAGALVGVAAWISATSGGSSSKPTTEPTQTSAVVSSPGVATAGSVSPDFDLPRLSGVGRLRLDDLRGRPVILNFWASWCIPCRKEFPVLRRVQRQHRADGVEIIGIVYNDIASDARAFARNQKATWNLVTDESRATAVKYGVRAIPQTFFIAPDGRITQRYFQAPSEATFDAEIAKILRPTNR